MDAQSGSRALSAANDLVEMLRLAQSAAERVAREVYGVSYEHAELIERELQRLRRSADKLQSLAKQLGIPRAPDPCTLCNACPNGTGGPLTTPPSDDAIADIVVKKLRGQA